MSKAQKLLDKMRSNPQDDWTPANVKTICDAFGLILRQRGTSHAVLTNKAGNHLTVPMHKPIKAIYIRRLVELVNENEN